VHQLAKLHPYLPTIDAELTALAVDMTGSVSKLYMPEVCMAVAMTSHSCGADFCRKMYARCAWKSTSYCRVVSDWKEKT
jgi:hypothetical protein